MSRFGRRLNRKPGLKSDVFSHIFYLFPYTGGAAAAVGAGEPVASADVGDEKNKQEAESSKKNKSSRHKHRCGIVRARLTPDIAPSLGTH